MTPTRALRRLSLTSAAAVAILAGLLGSAPMAAGANTQTLLASSDRPLILGDLAAADNVAVVWQHRGQSLMRWSTDDGATFAPASRLRNGFRATDPRVAACGDFIWAASVWRSDASAHIGIDYRAPGSATTGQFRLAEGTSPDIACLGDVVAVTYQLEDGMFRVAILNGPCANPCVPAYEADLGSGAAIGRATVAAFDRGFVVAQGGAGIALRRFIVTGDAEGLTITPKPVLTLMPGKSAFHPQIAADGSRVVIAYIRRGQTHMRISDDRGRTFGSAIVVSKFCLDCPEGGSSADSIDARNGRILVEVGRHAGTPPAVEELGFLTQNDGATWTKTPIHSGGDQFGVLLDGGLAEAWDAHHYADPIYGNVAQEIRFRTQSLP